MIYEAGNHECQYPKDEEPCALCGNTAVESVRFFEKSMAERELLKRWRDAGPENFVRKWINHRIGRRCLSREWSENQILEVADMLKALDGLPK